MAGYVLLDICFILLLGHIHEHSTITINDLCQNSTEEKLLRNYTFISSFPRGGSKKIIHQIHHGTDEKACLQKCCDNTLCNAALSVNMVCFTFECVWDKLDYCKPMTVKKEKYKLAKYFLLRTPITRNIPSVVNVQKRAENISTPSSVPITSAVPKIKELLVDISDNQTIILPVNYVTLKVNVHGDKIAKYQYQWTLLSKPSNKNSGKLDTMKTNELKLTDLIAGDYEFKVEVRGNGGYGMAKVFVFVEPAKKKNLPPVAKIVPSTQTVQLPNNVILDGSKSTDDDKIVSYLWELIKGPLEAEKTIKTDQSMLNLQHLSAGNYTFKLTVKDATGAASSDIANLTLLAEKDYPPTADPGNNFIVELPVKYVILNGSGSKDDKKIVSYQWTKKSDGLAADIQGVRAPILNLTNLQEGTYTFNLKVIDSAGQSNDKDVQIFVKPRTNTHPIAKASVTNDRVVTVRLPATEAILNGSLSNDDDKITRYQWQQIEGQPKLNLIDADKPIAYVDDLKIGVFKFNLTVYDKEKLSSSDSVTLRINESRNQKPKAKILSQPKYYHLETNLVKIDGSKSWDDVKIVQYKWTREDDSLAIGEVLEDSDSSAVLMLTDLLPGIYKFKLQVYDVEGLSDSDVTILEVFKSKYENNLVELQFISSLSSFTEFKKNAFLNNIQSILQKKLISGTNKVVVHLVQMDKIAFENSVVIVFYVTMNKGAQSSSVKVTSTVKTQPSIRDGRSPEITGHQEVVEEVYVEALRVVDALSETRYNSMSIEYQVARVETYVCQNNCSNHGQCNAVTKLCECETFWTSSYARDRFGDGRPNCDWSIIYLSILFGIMIFIVLITCWFLLWIRNKRCRQRKSTKIRKHKYTKINDYDYEEDKLSLTEKLPKFNGIKSRMKSEKISESGGRSDSTMSSEEETVFTTSTTHRIDHSSLISKSASLSAISSTNGSALKAS